MSDVEKETEYTDNVVGEEEEYKSENEQNNIVDNDEEAGEGNEQEYENRGDGDDDDDDVFTTQSHKLSEGESAITKKKNVRKIKKDVLERSNGNDRNEPAFVGLSSNNNDDDGDDGRDEMASYHNEDPQTQRRRLLEERMDSAVKLKSTRRRKADEDDLERMQDDRIDDLKDRMIKAANLDVDKNSQGHIATEKLKLLNEVSAVLSKADLAISILDNNLLEAVRLWLEPLPDSSMPAYQIQKELIHSLTSLPIKTDHLIASGIGKVLVFYQRSKRTEGNLKRIVDKLIGDWTRPILNKSDSYKDRTIQFNEYNKSKYTNQLQSQRQLKPKEEKTLYEQSAERRRRAAIPAARTTAYKIAPKVDPSLLRRQQMRSSGSGLRDERFRRLNQKLTSMGVKKTVKKGGPSIEGRNLAM